MQRDEIDVMWQQALRDSVKDGEMFARYHFAKLVADSVYENEDMFTESYALGHSAGVASEREACAKRAKIALLGTLKTTSDSVLKAIRSTSQL